MSLRMSIYLCKHTNLRKRRQRHYLVWNYPYITQTHNKKKGQDLED